MLLDIVFNSLFEEIIRVPLKRVQNNFCEILAQHGFLIRRTVADTCFINVISKFHALVPVWIRRTLGFACRICFFRVHHEHDTIIRYTECQQNRITYHILLFCVILIYYCVFLLLLKISLDAVLLIMLLIKLFIIIYSQHICLIN